MTLLARFAGVCAVSLLWGAWQRLLSRKTRIGFIRVLACLPAIVWNLTCHAAFDSKREFISKGTVCIVLFWAANFKILSFCIGRGPLSQDLSRAHFILTYALPITPQLRDNKGMPKIKSNSRLEQSAGNVKTLATAFIGKSLLQTALVTALSKFGDDMPIIVREFLQGFLLYTFLGIMMDINAAIIVKLANLPVSPHFDSPFLSASLGEFWSKRWNLTIGNTLRTLVYDPISEGRLVPSTKPYKASQLRSAFGMCLSFIVSGLMHAILFGLLNTEVSAFPWFVFFAVQGPILIIERIILRITRKKGLLPPLWFRIPFTLLLLWSVAHVYLFPPAVAAKLPDLFYACFLESLQSLAIFKS